MSRKLTGKWASVAAAILLAAPVAGAQPSSAADRETARVEAEARMREAEQRLQEAAREIAELTARMVGETGMTVLREFAGNARRAMLGVNIGPVGGRDAREDGVQVLGVTPGSPADVAGLRSGDVLITVAETALDWSGNTSPVEKLLEVLRDVEPGTKITLSYRRDGEVAQVAVEARPWASMRALLPPNGPLPPDFMARFRGDIDTRTWGDMEMVALTPGLGDYFDVDEGILVVRAPADSTLGLQDGDVIVDIAGRKPSDPAHVVRILRSYSAGERLVMTVVRQGRRHLLEADIPG